MITKGKDIRERTFLFASQIVVLIQSFPRSTAGFAIGSQLIRSGTSIGANIEESQNAPTRKDFIRGMTIALKEAQETQYWLRLIKQTALLPISIDSYIQEVTEICKVLTVIIKRTKSGLK